MFQSFIVVITAFGTAIGSGAMAILLRHIEKSSLINHYKRKIESLTKDKEATEKSSINEEK